MPTEEQVAASVSSSTVSTAGEPLPESAPPGNGTVSVGASERPQVSFGADNARIGIPTASRRKRPSPAYDPMLRTQISRTAKWLMLVGVLLFVAWIPSVLYISPERQAEMADPNSGALSFDPFFHDLALIAAASIFATVIATGLPRLVLPRLFGRWGEPAEALRDWLIVGVVTGLIYFLATLGMYDLKIGPIRQCDLSLPPVAYLSRAVPPDQRGAGTGYRAVTRDSTRRRFEYGNRDRRACRSRFRWLS